MDNRCGKKEPFSRFVSARFSKGFAVGVILLSLVFLPVRAMGRPPLHVAVSIPPQAFFVRQIGGDRVTVQVLLPPGANPATFEPKARALMELSKASLYFRIHVPFENAWMGKFRAVNGEMKVVDTTEGLKDLVKGDPHVWLSPELVKRQAVIIADALGTVDKGGKKNYEENLKRFLKRLDSLAREIGQRLRKVKRRVFLAYHPCWGYFAREFGLTQIAIEQEGKAPGAAYLSKVIRLARERHLRCVFAQPQFDTRSAEIVARQIHGRLVLLDPMAEDWEANLLKVAEKIGSCLRE